MRIGDAIWEEVVRWDYFARDRVGKQLVRCADSIAANIAEATGATISPKAGTSAAMPEAPFRNPSPS